MEALEKTMTNPMGVLYHWVKGENYDIGSFQACLAGRNAVAKRVKRPPLCAPGLRNKTLGAQRPLSQRQAHEAAFL